MSNASAPDPRTVQRLQSLLQRDLMLGPGVTIDPDQPLFGGDLELDSLDALLLVTSVEKEFGIKIPDASIGKQIFASVNILALWVDGQKR